MDLIILSEDLKHWRAERPDEWTMDRFIRAAEKLERSTIHNKDYAELEKLYYQQLRRTDKLEADYEELENQRDELRNALNETMLGYDMWLETNGYSYENYDKYKQLLARIKDGEK